MAAFSAHGVPARVPRGYVHPLSGDFEVASCPLLSLNHADVTVSVTASRVDPRWPDALNGHHALSLEEGHGRLLTR